MKLNLIQNTQKNAVSLEPAVEQLCWFVWEAVRPLKVSPSLAVAKAGQAAPSTGCRSEDVTQQKAEAAVVVYLPS